MRERGCANERVLAAFELLEKKKETRSESRSRQFKWIARSKVDAIRLSLYFVTKGS